MPPSPSDQSKGPTRLTPSGAAKPTARERILDAAAELMKHKAPSQITGRELASTAGVNYGLVHHYFGGKNGACQEAFTALAQRYVDSAQESHAQDWILSMGDLPEYADLWRILAHAAMDGESLEMLGWDYPLLRARLAARTSERGADAGETSEAIATAFSLALGWIVFQPFIKEALGLGDQQATAVGESIVRRIDELW
ncbi:TetR/AcrR family transcriptional regulator [Nocardioides soli]|uniref:AcrR family transcriptional regulator n=1 Tax=Nocardioides soli TaxID=1036020 RepID=A0A7W4VYP7_9ACTN|nr:TetR/AcrR family transcriptional regulator [Nocardioides soli]MBB3044184.1 AcrR family transcriptional regulator [Nocardioides soli]